MYVYFMQSGKNGPIKIGKSNDPEKRIKNIQTGNPYELKLIATVYCDTEKEAYSLEGRFHRVLKKYRMHGEWFRPNFSIKKAMEAKFIKEKGKDIEFERKGKKEVKEIDEASLNHMYSIMQE